jgi:Protein of unknown function (DUF1553)/Protein of unknown function (DUF1549)/Planctomycete cytochrome C
MSLRPLILSGLCLLGLASVARAAGRPDFQREIRPILSEKCFACHGPDEAKVKAGLRLDSGDSAFRELKSGKRALVPGKPEQSALLARVLAGDPDEVMPPPKTGKHITKDEAELLRRWIAGGAELKGHWAFEVPTEPVPPKVRDAKWCRSAVDRFILARLTEQGFKPEAEADKFTLLRRVSLDLTGLPPTPAEVDAFLHDDAPGAFERVVDRLLDSPAFGERMAQWWLDLARYADTNGYHIDNNRDIWLWREWVIKAFNRNVPFDRFTVEQLAGDLLPNRTLEQRVASGFNRNTMVNFEGGADPEEYLSKYCVDRVNTTAVTWLGLTVGCAECHDHKYDPVTTREFYQFYAFFNTIAEQGLDGNTANPAPSIKAPSPEQQAELDRRQGVIAALQKQYDARVNSPTTEEAAAQAAWEKSLRTAVADGWQTLAPNVATSAGGATLTTQADLSVLASGTNAAKDVYEITLTTPATELRAIRLEALTHETMTAKAFARSDNGNFVMTGFEAVAEAADLAREPKSDPATLGRWWSVGPFKANDANDAFNRAFVDEAAVDLAKTYDDGKLKWTERPNWKDGEITKLTGDNAATYLYRTITVPHAQLMRLSLGSDDGIRGWLNGRPLLAHNASRAAAPDQEIVLLPLQPGENRLLLKISNGGGDYAFYFRLQPEPVLSHPVTFAAAVADFSQKDFPPTNLIDGKSETGWAVEGHSPEHRHDHQAILVATQPFGFASGTRLKLKLRFESVFPQHAAGHFRLAVSDSAALAEFTALPEPVRGVFFRRNGELAPSDRTLLTRNYIESRSPAAKELAAKLAGERDGLDRFTKTLPETMVMAEMDTPRDTFQLIRGNFQSRGDKLLPGTPKFLPPLRPANPARATRLDLAQWLVDPAQPLTARVTVNRLWQLFFGTGLVKTANDFGNQGDRPSHPELLDWLAYDFSHGIATPGGARGRPWDMKAMVRLLVTSSTYRQRSTVTPEKLERDPYNRLLTRGPRFRLDAEFLRDQALAVAGLLDRRIGGPSVKPYQPPGLWEAIGFGNGFSSQSYEPSHGADLYRRGLYVYWKRSLPHPALTTFDAPSREVCTVSRPRTSTPLQALVLLNDPQYVEAARGLAQRVLREAKGDLHSQLTHAFRLALARPPRPEEVKLLERIYRQQLANYTANHAAAEQLLKVGESARPPEVEAAVLAAWTALGNVLLNLDEVITKG